MNKVFEAFTASVFRKVAWQAGLKMREQGPQKYMLRREDSDKDVFLMQPDMVFLNKASRPVVIADAKWKLLDEREKKLGISQGDLYQIAAYASRYRVGKVALVYPRQKKLMTRIDFKLHNMNTLISIIPLDVTESVECGFALSFLEHDSGK